MICPVDPNIRTKLMENFYNSLPDEVSISKEDLLNHINLDGLLNLLKANKPKRKFNIKPKDTTIKQEKKIVKFKRNLTLFQKFANICNKNKIPFFRYNSEFGWVGPAIKIFEEQYDELYPKFESIPTEIQHGIGFIIVHPSVFISDHNITYQTISITPENSDESDEEVETIPWKYDGVMYDLNETTNNVYCRQTHAFVGKRNELDRLDRSAIESN